MAEFRLERFKYNWKGIWASDIAYKRDDVVRVNGKSYVCVLTHVSGASFRDDLNAILPGSVPPQPQPKWTVMTSGRYFAGTYASGTDYNLGDIVAYDGVLWLCTTDHNSTGSPSEASNWEVYADNISYLGEWQTGTTYGPGAVVKYNGINYKCITAHNSSSSLESSIDNWKEFYRGIEYLGEWQNNTVYRKNDLVLYGGTIFRCVNEHTSGSDAISEENFQPEIFGSQYDGEWDPTTYYNVGDVVRHRGFMYYAINNNYESRPYDDNGSLDWILLARNYQFVGIWNIDADYKTGDIVLRGGNLYIALRDIGTGQNVDGSTVDYLDESTWELLVPGNSFKGNWTSGTTYSVGDVVYFKGSSYTCNFEHEASIVNFPGDNGSGYFFWDVLIQAGQPAALREKGDILTYGFSREIDDDGSTIFDGSTLGDTRLRIGESEQVLSVSEDFEVFWRDVVEDAEAIYVATNGVDDEGRGTFQKPFRTIRYAAEYVEDNFEPLTPVVIRVSAGKYNEIAPIIVPAGCAVNGDELRSTTVIANSAFSNYQNDYNYVLDYLLHLESYLVDVISGIEVTPTVGNTEPQVTEVLIPVLDAQGNPLVDSATGQVILENIFPESSEAGAGSVLDHISDFKDFVQFRIGTGGGVDPVLVGTALEGSVSEIVNAGAALYYNRKFIVAESIAYLQQLYPNIAFDGEKIKSDITSLLRALKKDLELDNSNYYTLNSARRYANAVTGSRLDNLFLLRDTTGLRDMTTGGLLGDLNPPGVFDLYQKPTGGSCVSLDPGWGPDDERVWIKNRSPYVQGVTNTGTGCVGMKVDGALHNGGNRSMVANDFTQVLSDGVGAWITNNARAELVSVFTYYCQIGYFAEDGGIIRATNGNNSYGKYGSIADGVDADEIPQNATLFNRNNEAIIEEAFAGGSNDELIAFEYSNAGEEYRTAIATIIGAGSNASVEYKDFRNGALFEARLTSADGSSTPGGSGYLVRQGNAQETPVAASIIKLSSTDATQLLSEIEGMRIIITDGVGVGQYGYVDGFTFATKEVTVRRDSDNELGWDHLVPGTPLVTSFDLTSRYRIEPRIVSSLPSSSTTEYDLFTSRNYVDLEYGDTTEIYNGVTGGSSYIWQDSFENYVTISNIISPIALQFTAQFLEDPRVPFTIKGRTSGSQTSVTAITARTEDTIEVDVTSSLGFIVGEEIDIVSVSGSGETFDTVPVPATFNVVREGRSYSVSVATSGAGYSAGDKIKILGTALGGTTPENDLLITVLTASDDSTNGILTVESSGLGKKGRFVALTTSEYARYSDNGVNFTEVTLPFIGNGSYRNLIAGNNRFIVVAENEDRIASSLNGVTWTEVALPLKNLWQDGCYGGGKFLIVGSDTDLVLVSTDGENWTTSSIPNDSVGDSTISQWYKVSYGKGTYVVLSANDRATATSADGVNWIRNDQSLPVLSGNITSITYGKNRFVVVTDASESAYSFDGITWYVGGTMPNSLAYTVVKYAQGIFLALGNDAGGPTLYSAESADGINWTQRNLASSKPWTVLGHDNNDSGSQWVIFSDSATVDGINHLKIGTRPIIRANVVTGQMKSIQIIDPGSNFNEQNPPVLTITDPNVLTPATYESRIGNRVLAQPEFINRGSGYRRATSSISISGDGYADIIPEASTITLAGVRNIPNPGVQIEIDGVLDPNSNIPGDLFVFSGVEVFDLGDDGTNNNTRLVKFTISPSVEPELNLQHATAVTLREKFSQCRISGHDFLDIGTGNFEETNYPKLYSGGRFFTAAPENEVYETNGGRIFYVSTDQDGNFRTGELFSVQQATGIVTISAQFFDLDGLSELALGGVRLGGSGAVVQEFSTDPTFAADSNNVVPTQRAIATFLADRLSVGGENLEVNQLQAGRVILGGEDNQIRNAAGGYLILPGTISFDGTYTANDGEGNITTEQVNVSGTILSQVFLFRDFDQTMQ